MSKINNSVNTMSIFTSLLMLALCYWSRTGLTPYFTGLNYFSLFALVATLFCLPDFLCYYFPSADKWYRTSEFYTISLIIALGIVGLLLPKYSSLLTFIILPVGISLAFWELFHFIQNKNLLILAAGSIVMGFIVFLFYSRSYVSSLFPEQIILGNAHIDTIFPCSMSNMFATLGWPSTGLDGSPFIRYHWGSQALFGGLKNWIGINSLMFYNIAYPVIFIPLFFKSFISFLRRLLFYKGVGSFNLLFAISFIAVLYSLKITGFAYATPLKFESLTISLIYTFLFFSTLLAYVNKPGKNNHLFFWYSIVLLLLISSAKISTGAVCIIGMTYLHLRVNRGFSKFLMLFIGGLIIVAFYMLIFPSDRLTIPVTLMQRISNLWHNSVSFITYFCGALIAVLVLLKKQPLRNWDEIRSVIKSKEYIDLEILFIITLASFIGALPTTTYSTDVFMFCMPQFFLSIPFLILFSQKYFDQFAASSKAKTLFLLIVIFLSVFSNPDAVTNYTTRILHVKRSMQSLSENQQVLQGFLAELFKLDKEGDKNETCIYIPKTENWYYHSQSDTPLGQISGEPSNPMSSPMIVPAVTGIALIGGISDSIYQSGYIYAGYYYYKNEGQKQISNLAEAKKRAVRKGYSKLIAYQYIGKALVRQDFNLKK
jgi:hypothetical protein